MRLLKRNGDKPENAESRNNKDGGIKWFLKN